VLSGIKLKLVFIQNINVDAKYQCFFVFGGPERDEKNSFFGASVNFEMNPYANTYITC
jgi:hypothetical protein